MDVSIAVNGRIAVEMVGNFAYDLILMDVQMPEMGGLEATEAIRRLPDRQAVPILAMTANAFDDDRNHCLQAGMNDHLPKPVEPEKLYRSLVKWLPERTSGHREAGQVTPLLRKNSFPSDASDMLSSLSAINGLNAAAGIRRYMDNLPQYICSLQQFSDRHGDDAARLSDQLEAGQLKAVFQTAHGLKGVAGLLGAERVQQRAMELEKAARQKLSPDIVTGRLQELTAELMSLLSALDEVLPRETTPCQDAAIDWAEVETVLEKLEPLLATDNTAVNDIFDEFEELLRYALGGTGDLLGRQIRNFDYADALITLHTAREKGLTNTTCPLEE
jgi:CheY-like chemotaxis protein